MLTATNLMGPHIVATKLNKSLNLHVHEIADETVMHAQLKGEVGHLGMMVDTLRDSEVTAVDGLAGAGEVVTVDVSGNTFSRMTDYRR